MSEKETRPAPDIHAGTRKDARHCRVTVVFSPSLFVVRVCVKNLRFNKPVDAPTVKTRKYTLAVFTAVSRLFHEGLRSPAQNLRV